MPSFDPYHKWLGIPPKDQPPNHYRLLGIAFFESDPDVIDAAASRQAAYLQGCATGPHVALSQKLLNEIAAARLCLLSPQKKPEYDQQLRETLKQVAACGTTDGDRSYDRSLIASPRNTDGIAGCRHSFFVFTIRQKKQKKRARWQLWTSAGVGGLVVVILLVVIASNRPVGHGQVIAKTSAAPPCLK